MIAFRVLARTLLLAILCASLGALPALAQAAGVAFCAHKNYTNQGGLTAQVYNPISMPTETYDLGGRYASSAWVPVQSGEEARVVVFSGQVWVPYDGAAGLYFTGAENLVVRIAKNGLANTIGTAVASKGPFPDDFVLTISMQDVAQPGDSYELFLYAYDPDAFIDGHPLHTFWCGVVIP